VKHVLIKASVLTGLVVFGTSVYAQNKDDDRYYQTNRDEGWWRGHLFERVRDDLDHIQQVTPKISADEYRLVVVKKDLNDLQSKMESNRYDEPALDRTIAAVEKVANDNNLSPRDKAMMLEDMRRLRDFREHHDGYK
jgi:hypothetical protein